MEGEKKNGKDYGFEKERQLLEALDAQLDAWTALLLKKDKMPEEQQLAINIGLNLKKILTQRQEVISQLYATAPLPTPRGVVVPSPRGA